MTRARIRLGASMLSAGFLAALSLSAGSAKAQPPPTLPTPDAVTPQTPIPVPILLYQWIQLTRMPAAAPQTVTCPRHTKPSVDCTPVR
jgi:hypothetical protein